MGVSNVEKFCGEAGPLQDCVWRISLVEYDCFASKGGISIASLSTIEWCDHGWNYSGYQYYIRNVFNPSNDTDS
ncbi:hypothetical protein J36TS2_30480 [Bacillus paralicheniformis]|jgi:hypothetical protein|nr:hypothetical protein J25TS1_39480 [Bacillus paralicheniformis]GIN54154.1 hypothetical protein J36TS2_30480 [Bacillus paralicheniformis]GIN78758.1 hypothetical protein J41TS8_37990 [Bacillus sp. J41TS8]